MKNNRRLGQRTFSEAVERIAEQAEDLAASANDLRQRFDLPCTVSLRIPASMLAKLDAKAHELNLKRPSLIRKYILDALKPCQRRP
jgi:hypothetical protein